MILSIISLPRFLHFVAYVVLSCVTVLTTPSYADSNHYEVGVILPLSGDLAIVGQKVRKGVEFSAKSYGNKIKLRFQDGGGSAKDAVTAFQQILLTSDPKAIIGPYGLDQTLAVAKASRSRDLIFIAVSACHPEYKAYPNIFCLYPSYQHQLDSTLKKFLGHPELQGKSLGLFIQESDSSPGIRKTMHSFARHNRMRVLFDETIITGSTDFRSQLVKARGIDVFFANSHSPSEMVVIFKQLRELGIAPERRWWFSEEDYDLIRQNSELLEGVEVIGSFDKLTPEFSASFSRTYGTPPDLYHALAADASATLFRGLLASSTTTDGSLKDRLINMGPEDPACRGFRFSGERTVDLSLTSKRIKDGQVKVES